MDDLGIRGRQHGSLSVWTVSVHRISPWPPIRRFVPGERVVRSIPYLGHTPGRRLVPAHLVCGLGARMVWGLSGWRHTSLCRAGPERRCPARPGPLAALGGAGSDAGRATAHLHSQRLSGALRGGTGSPGVSPRVADARRRSGRPACHRACAGQSGCVAASLRRSGIIDRCRDRPLRVTVPGGALWKHSPHHSRGRLLGYVREPSLGGRIRQLRLLLL